MADTVAYTEFCCRSGGSNLNAGTRLGDSTEPGTGAALTYASGTWVSATRIFTLASGNPITDGVAVGDFASVFPDANTVTAFVGRVTARDTLTITISGSASSGASPVNGTLNTTLKIGGAWLGPNAASGFPITFLTNTCTNSATNPPRINFKNDATYAITAAITQSGSTTGFAYQGYTTAYGDLGKAILDGGTSGAAYVLLTMNTNCHWVDFIFQNNGASSTAVLATTGSGIIVLRCVFNASRGGALSVGNLATVLSCEAYGCGLGGASTIFGGSVGGVYVNCIAHDNTATASNGFVGDTCFFCIADTNGGKGFLGCTAVNCEAYNNTGDGFFSSNWQAAYINCNSVKNTGIGFNAGAIQPPIFYNCRYGVGTQANSGGATSFGATTGTRYDSVSGLATGITPWVDPANGDFRINLAAVINAGYGLFTETAASYAGTLGYPDIGAAQHQETASGGGLLINPGLTGGLR